jgi:hypothetical protein
MVNRLDPINLTSFDGGLNLRKSTFELQPTESPEMNNITIDPLGGIYTRRGWDRWNGPDIVDPLAATWDPRRACLTQLSDGTDIVYIASDHKLYSGYATEGATISDIAVTCTAVPHMADFASWGNDLYIATGRDNRMAKRHQIDPPVLLTESGSGNWNDDYSTPVLGCAPKSNLVEAHSGYLFVANLIEDGVVLQNRIRWSHPTSPEDWAQADYIDIDTGGHAITGLMSFEDHLLIFKSDSIWALYGYNADSWQLVQKSSTIGALSPQSITRSETAVFFYSASDRGGIYAYGGERAVEISEQLRYALEMLISPELIWVGWIARKLWVTLPWTYDGPTSDNAAVFVFDPSVGNGAWTYFTCQSGGLGPIVAGSNTDTQLRPLGVLRSTETPCIVRLEALTGAADRIWQFAVLGVDDPVSPTADGRQGYLLTDTGAEIIASGMPGYEPFETSYRTPWVSAQWPTRKKSFRRPDFVCRITGQEHHLSVVSYRDYEQSNPKRRHTIVVPGGLPPSQGGGSVAATWGHFNWDDGTEWGQPGTTPDTPTQIKSGASIRRGSSFGLCRALQLRVAGATPGAHWGVDAIILKVVMRRFR